MEPHASQLCHAAHELSLQSEAEKIRVKWTEVCRFVAAATSSRMTHHILLLMVITRLCVQGKPVSEQGQQEEADYTGTFHPSHFPTI